MAKGYDPIVTNVETPFEIGKAILMRQGKDVLVITTGITLKFALECADEMNSKGIEVTILHMPTIKPLDTDTILSLAEKISVIVVIEEHSIIGGIGSAVAEVILEANYSEPKKFKRIGMDDRFPDEYGSQASLMERFSITKSKLGQVIQNLII